VRRGTARYPAQDPLLARQASRHFHRLIVADSLDAVDKGKVKHLRNETGAYSLDLVRARLQLFPGPRLGKDRGVDRLHGNGDDLLPLRELEIPAYPCDRTARSDTGNEDVHLPVRIVPELDGRRRFMYGRICGVLELLGKEIP